MPVALDRGTLLNGDPLVPGQSQPLRAGDRLTLGEVRLWVEEV